MFFLEFLEFPHDLGLVTSKSIGYQAFCMEVGGNGHLKYPRHTEEMSDFEVVTVFQSHF